MPSKTVFDNTAFSNVCMKIDGDVGSYGMHGFGRVLLTLGQGHNCRRCCISGHGQKLGSCFRGSSKGEGRASNAGVTTRHEVFAKLDVCWTGIDEFVGMQTGDVMHIEREFCVQRTDEPGSRPITKQTS